MTFHRAPLAVLRGAINKAVFKNSPQKKIRWRPRNKNNEAYARAVANNERMGLNPVKYRAEHPKSPHSIRSAAAKRRVPVSLAKVSFPP